MVLEQLAETKVDTARLQEELAAAEKAHDALDDELTGHRPKIKQLELELLNAQDRANVASDAEIAAKMAQDIEWCV